MKNILLNLNYYQWYIIYILFIINKIIEFPIILITHNLYTIIYIYITKKKKIRNIILLNIIPLIGLLIKKIIKNYFFIERPYNNIINNNNIINKIPLWLIKYWNEKKDSSFPSGHSIYSSFWILLFWKYKKKIYIKINIIILIIIMISRIILYVHRIQDILFSILITFIVKKIFKI